MTIRRATCSAGPIGLGIVIFVHELGHFLVAKACGVKCEKFYVGFDAVHSGSARSAARTLFKKQWGETEYGIGIIPLGGYVKMLGQDDNPANAAQEAERIRVAQATNDPSAVELDPRSYPAKSVPQRMAIISAGVIMNLIFAVVFATVAYRMGVEITPAEISYTVAGSPAWEAGMQPGDRIIQIGRKGRRDEQLDFLRDLSVSTLMTNGTQPLEMYVRHQDGNEEWISLYPKRLTEEKGATPKIGGGMPFGDTLMISSKARMAAAAAGLKTGDRVAKVTWDAEIRAVDSGYELALLLQQQRDQVLQLTVERATEDAADGGERPADSSSREVVTLTLPPQPLRGPGFRTQMGPIVRVRRDSPAEKAGVMEGDIVRAVNGQPVTEPLLLDHVLHAHRGSSVTMTVERSVGGRPAEVELTVAPAVPALLTEIGFGMPVAADSIGIAYDVTDTVAAVTPGSTAAESGIRRGDQLVALALVASENGSYTQQDLQDRKLDEIELLDDRYEWPALFSMLQALPPDVAIQATFRRGDTSSSTPLVMADLDGGFHGDRGVQFRILEETRTAKNWSAATALGWRETKSSVEQVLFILRNIGSLYHNIGGPVAIASVGTHEAGTSLPRLLVFLTMLSANLAVLNFSPIPVLDGGHMLFLIYEGLVGKPVNERVAFGLTLVGLCFILTLMVVVFGWDIYRLAMG